jgi:hypothetical protein
MYPQPHFQFSHPPPFPPPFIDPAVAGKRMNIKIFNIYLHIYNGQLFTKNKSDRAKKIQLLLKLIP